MANQYDESEILRRRLEGIDRACLRPTFKQATDTVNLAFRHIESRPISALAKDFVIDSANDIIHFISQVFS